MKILLYSANFAPEPVGIGKYSGEMAAWLVLQGHEVRVVAAPPYYPGWKLEPGYAWPLYRRERWENVDVWRTPIWVPRKPGGLTRILHLLTFAVSSLPVMFLQMFWRPDVVMTVAPAFVCAPAGWLVAKLTGAKAWLHMQDFEVDVAFQMGMLKGRRLKNIVVSMERWMLKRFDVVSSISGRMLQRLRDKGVSNDNIRLFPNWVDIDHVKTSECPSSYREQLNIAPGTKVSLFSGTLGAKQGLMVIPDAAHRLAHRTDIVFVVCGEGAMKAQLVEAAKALPNLLLLPLQPFERLGELLGLADVHLLTQSEDVEDLVLPSKLTGMLASGRAIIATCREGTEIAAVVSQCGVVVPPAHGAALAAAIERLADDQDQRNTMGSNARAYSETNLSREKVLGNLLAQLEMTFWTEPAKLSGQFKA